MHSEKNNSIWKPGTAPVAVVMISLNEGHNMEAVLQNLQGWAQEVFLVDSYSADDTVDIALKYGVHVVQRKFRNFGDQWNFALENLPIKASWTMKLDPDERLSEALKQNIVNKTKKTKAFGLTVDRKLWFMDRPMPVLQRILRIWRSWKCRFANVLVNEKPLVKGQIEHVKGKLKHYDSPDLTHWLNKQNHYTTAEAIMAYNKSPLSYKPKITGTRLQRRMWLKKNFHHLPFRYVLLFLYNWLVKGAWRAGWVGYAWACLRSDVMRFIDYKRREMEITGRMPLKRTYSPGKPDNRVKHYE